MVLRWWSVFGSFVAFLPVFVLTIHDHQPKPFAPGVQRKPGVYIEKWEGIDSFPIENLEKSARYPNLPTWRGYGTQFTQPKNWGENFGTRIRAYFVPKESGAHVFSISSDNSGELFFSNDEFPDHKSLIATVREERFSKPKQYNKYIEQRSWPVQLQKGHYYYIETLMKEFYDKDHLSVAVQTPTKFVAPITSDYLWTALPKVAGKEPPRIKTDIIKIAAKAGARAGASSGLMAATQSAARAGAEAGKLAGEEAGLKAGEAAAAAAAKSVFAKTFKTVLSAYKLGHLNFMIRLFGPNGEKIVRKYWNNNSSDNNITDLENNAPNHVINVHLYGKNGQNGILGNNPQGSSSSVENSYLPNTGVVGGGGGDGGDGYGNAYGQANQRKHWGYKNENPTDSVFGSDGQLIHSQKYVPIDLGSHPRQGQQSNGQRKSDDLLANPQNDEDENPPQFTVIESESNKASLSQESRTITPSYDSETNDPSIPHFDAMEQNDYISTKSSFNRLQNDDNGQEVGPVFTSIVSAGANNSTASNAGTQSTRENEIFVYYPKVDEDADEMARKLVYEGGPASKVVFNGQYSIHSLDIPAIQLNITKNLCLNSFDGKINLRGQCQYFIIREGLLPKTGTDDISLESSCVPGHYLVQRNYKFHVDKRDGTLHFAREATFALYKTMAFPFSLQIMSFSHYMWFMCESKNKDPHKTEIELEYVNSKESAINRCSFTFLPLPYGWDPKKNCKGVLNFEIPKIRGQQKLPALPTEILSPDTKSETCVALNFINKAGIPFRLLSDIKHDRYMVVGKNFKLKTIIKRPDLHHHITYRAEDPTGKNTMLLFGDSTVTLLPQHRCEEFVPVEVTSKPGFFPPFGESVRPAEKSPEEKRPDRYHLHYHLPSPASPRPPPPPPPSSAGCGPSCSYPLSCAYYCPSHCCKKEVVETITRSVVPRAPKGCICGSDCSPKAPSSTLKCYRLCQYICKANKQSKNG